VAGGQPVAALLRRLGGVVAGDVAGGGLLFEPLADVAGGDAGGGGDLGLGGGAEVVERLVEPELQAQVDAERLQRVGGGIDEPLGERLARVEVGVGGHGSSRAPRSALAGVDGWTGSSSSEGPQGEVAQDRGEVAGPVVRHSAALHPGEDACSGSGSPRLAEGTRVLFRCVDR
jgi:hypothetical protein